MANDDKFRRLQCEQACEKMIEEALEDLPTGGMDVYHMSAEEASGEWSNDVVLTKFPFIIDVLDGDDHHYFLGSSYSGDLYDDTSASLSYNLAEVTYDAENDQLTALLTVTGYSTGE